jgi:hypothetical protein
MNVGFRFLVSRLKPNTVKLLGLVCLLLLMAPATLGQSDPTISINDITVPERDNGLFSGKAFTLTLSAASTKQVSVTCTTQAGSATDNVDFGAGSLVVTFQPGQTTQTLDVFINGDTIPEGTEDFFVNLSNPVNATIADGQGVETIIDDDALILLTQTGSQRAVALDSVFFTMETFPIVNTLNFSSDNRTRIMVFAIGLKLSAGETASAVTATAEDAVGTLRPLTVEFVGTPANFEWLSQVNLKLNDQIPVPADAKIRISLHGQTSNAVPVAVKAQ